MEFESKLLIVSKSLEDMRDAVRTVFDSRADLYVVVKKAILSFDDPDNVFFFAEIDNIPYWSPFMDESKRVMDECAGILGETGFAFLDYFTPNAPDYHYYTLTYADGFSSTSFEEESYCDVGTYLKDNYGEVYEQIYLCGRKGDPVVWTEDDQPEPPMPAPLGFHKTENELTEEEYTYKTSSEFVEAYNALLDDEYDLSDTYEKFRESFNAIKVNRELMATMYPYIIPEFDSYKSLTLYEDISLKERLDRAEKLQFYGRVFHIRNAYMSYEYSRTKLSPQLDSLIDAHETELKTAIAKRGGIIDYSSHDYTLMFADCIVLSDNEGTYFTHTKDRKNLANKIEKYKLECVSRYAIWYAICNTPELSREELNSLRNESFYLNTINTKKEWAMQIEIRLQKEAEEKERQLNIQREKDLEVIIKLLEDKYKTVGAGSYAQIGREVNIGKLKALNEWDSVNKYIVNKTGITASKFFKEKGIIGKKKSPAKRPKA